MTSILQLYNLETKIFMARKQLDQLEKDRDLFSFLVQLEQCIKLFQLVSYSVRSQRNSFGAKLPPVLLMYILNFASNSSIQATRRVCKTWLRSLQNPLQNAKHTRYVGGKFVRSWTTISPGSISMNGNNLYVYGGHKDKMEIWTPEGVKLHSSKRKGWINRSDGNEKYHVYCADFDKKVQVISPGSRTIAKWQLQLPLGVYCVSIAIHDEFIYVLSSSCFYTFTMYGRQVSQWMIPLEMGPRKIAVRKDEIYMVEPFSCRITVFSKDGKVLREWGSRGKKPGEFDFPWGITIYHSVVYIVDAGNCRIQAFLPDGSYLFEISYVSSSEMENIVAMNGSLYVSDLSQSKILVFKLSE